MKVPTSPIRPPHNRRYGWFRQYNDFPTHPKWDVVTMMACVEKSRVLGIVTCLEVAANKGRPRGSVADFSLLECAAALRIAPVEVERVYKALEHVGWIDREYLTTWDERQPDKEDPTNTLRQQRYREKKRSERNTVTPVDITPRPDTDKKEEEALPEVGNSVNWAEAEAWRKAKQSPLPLGPVVVKRRGYR